MKVRVDSWAWLPKSELTVTGLQALKQKLTIVPKRFAAYADEDDEDPGPILLYTENADSIGVAREYFLQRKTAAHQIEYALSDGAKGSWPGPLQFASARKLRTEQQLALMTVLQELKHGGRLGGLVKAPPGWG